MYTPPSSSASAVAVPNVNVVNKPVQAQGITSSGMTCWNCHERGHTRVNCQSEWYNRKNSLRQVATKQQEEDDYDSNTLPSTPLPPHTTPLFDQFTGQRLRAVRIAQVAAAGHSWELSCIARELWVCQ